MTDEELKRYLDEINEKLDHVLVLLGEKLTYSRTKQWRRINGQWTLVSVTKEVNLEKPT